MKRKEFQQLRDLTIEDLRQRLAKTEAEAVKAKMEISRGKIKNVHLSLAKRKEIAKIKTLIREKEVK